MPSAIGRPDEDPAARLGTLFDTHHQRLFRLAHRLARRPEDAHDLVQETFLRAARSPASIPDGHSSEEATAMEINGFRGKLTDQQMLDVLSYIRTVAPPDFAS